MRKIQTIFLMVMFSMLSASLVFAAEGSFKARLGGNESVPAVKTKAKGDAEFKLSKDGKSLHYKLKVSNINNVNAAHIHKGKKGQNGPVVAGLFAGPKKEGNFKGTLSEGTITEKELMGELEGKTVDTLVQLIKSGDLFVNVHTDTYPDGEIRGQIK